MHPLLRVLAWVEGASLILLFFVAMPLKYAMGRPEAVRVVGMAHGILFLAFVVVLLVVGNQRSWGSKKLILGLLASCVPFGTMWFDRQYLTK